MVSSSRENAGNIETLIQFCRFSLQDMEEERKQFLATWQTHPPLSNRIRTFICQIANAYNWDDPSHNSVL